MAMLEIKYFMEKVHGPDKPGVWHKAITGTHTLTTIFTACGEKFAVHDSDPVKYGEPHEWDLYQDTLCHCIDIVPTEAEIQEAKRKVHRIQAYGGSWRNYM